MVFMFSPIFFLLSFKHLISPAAKLPELQSTINDDACKIFKSDNRDHLVVLSHGMLGTTRDLNYLASKLKSKGCVVLMSSANSFMKSLLGVEIGGSKLAKEVLEVASQYSNLSRISFVGNSLGGLFCRYAIRELFNSTDNTIAGLAPDSFISIATPHLGVRNYTFISVPDSLKLFVSSLLYLTGTILQYFHFNY